jgi:RecB family exonuclease
VSERLFPRKLVEDPILLDEPRRALSDHLETEEHRVDAERTRLRLAVGAANKRVVVSWPRLDASRSRPRVPSFYGLEIIRAAEGTLPGFAELGERADRETSARIAWPAPSDPAEAIDAAEHDLALFGRVRRKSQAEAAGTMRYLLSTNRFLARSLRARYARWSMAKYTQFDGLSAPRPEGRAAMAGHQLSERSFSATALQDFASCPYRFALRTIFGLSPREEPEAIEYLDPMSRGSLIHDTQYEVLTELRNSGKLPLTPASLPAARDILDATLDIVAARYADDLCPAIPRVWNDAVAAMRTDLQQWLRLASEDGAWVPHRFELAFGLRAADGRDEHSTEEPAALDCGIQLRGAIDLIEEAADGTLRVTDYKTGKARVPPGTVVSGGAALQPVLYALAAEKLFPGQTVVSGRLWYCTSTGGFKETVVELDDLARRSAQVLAETLDRRLERVDLPAVPREGACRWCDYAAVCGPHEEQRTRGKSQAAISDLVTLRSLR